MKVGFYSPYLDTLGGGEQYLFSLISCFTPHDEVFLYASDQDILLRARERYGISVDGVKLTSSAFGQGAFIQRVGATVPLDVLFFFSDGSIPLSFAKKTYLIFQFPVPWVDARSLLTYVKLRRISGILCYSQFVKQYLDVTFGIPAFVLPPAIVLAEYSDGPKEKQILSVGRFTRGMNVKRQDAMIAGFKELVRLGITDWKFVLAGGALPEDHDFVKSLQQDSRGYHVEVIENISRAELLMLYQKSPLYWHAAGFGVDISKHPESVEHFGITTVEAMASGGVPIVFPAGGQREIVTDSHNGLYWETVEKLAQKSKLLIDQPDRQMILAKQAKIDAKAFDLPHFQMQVKALLENK